MNELHYFFFMDRHDVKPRWREYLCWDGEANAFVEFPSTLLAYPFTESEARDQDTEGRYTWRKC